jgi:hypothetical protein
MKVKQYIVTYNNAFQINNCLKSIFNSLSDEELNMIEINIINNHSNLNIDSEFTNKVNILHNTLRPDFSTGHLSRSWNQAIINGFKNLKNPDCDILITNQDDTIFQPNYINKLVELHKQYDLIQFGGGDNYVSYTPNAIKRIGLWDERFCNIGFQEGDYFLRAVRYNADRVSINDGYHFRVNNPLDNTIITVVKSGYHRLEEYHMESHKYHYISRIVFNTKWGVDPVNTAESVNTWADSVKKLNPIIPSFMYYPYFEKDVETLNQQNYIGA